MKPNKKTKQEIEQAKKLELMDKLLAKSKLTEEDVLEIGRKIKHGIARRHGLIK